MLRKGIFVTGTDTEVGKTQVTAGLAAVLQKRIELKRAAAVQEQESKRVQTALPRNDVQELQRMQGAVQVREEQKTQREQTALQVREEKQARAAVQLWKPVQSGAALGTPAADSYRLLHGSGLAGSEADIASHTFTAPVAPWLAARLAGTPLIYRDLVAEGRRRLARGGCLLVEGAGGLLVPLADEQRMVDLAADLELPLLIIARTGLGTVNHTLLTVECARQAGLEVLGVILNGCEPAGQSMAADNARMIEQFGKVSVLGILPWLAHDRWDEAGWKVWRQRWTSELERNLKLDVFYHSQA